MDATGQRICAACAGLNIDFACAGCGTTGLTPIDGLCFDCLAARRVAELTGAVREGDSGLGPFAEALLGAGCGEAVWQWLGPSKPTSALVAAIVAADAPPSHRLLDELPQTPPLHRLRAVLMHADLLEQRADYLERIAPWLEELLADRPAAHAQPVRAWAHWTLLRRARSRLDRRPFTEGAAHAMRQAIRAAVGLLTWIDDNELALAGLTQRNVDRWLTEGNPGAYQARDFLKWACSRGLAGQADIPLRQPRTALAPLSEEQRWSALRTCLTDTTLPDDVRAAGALLLLYGIPVSTISGLQRSAVTRNGASCELTIKNHRLKLVPAVAALISRRLKQLPADCPWLFPGAQPGRPVNTAALRKRLGEHHVPRHDQARAAALNPPGLRTATTGLGRPAGPAHQYRTEMGSAHPSRPDRLPTRP